MKAIFLLILLASCASNNNYNQVVQSEFAIKGGIYKGVEWEEALKLEKTTWFQQAVSQGEIIIGKVNRSSKYNLWLEGNKDTIFNQCNEFYIVLTYAPSYSASISSSYIDTQLERTNGEIRSVPNLNHHLRSSYIVKSKYLFNHKIKGLCIPKGKQFINAEIDIPGFKSVKLFK